MGVVGGLFAYSQTAFAGTPAVATSDGWGGYGRDHDRKDCKSDRSEYNEKCKPKPTKTHTTPPATTPPPVTTTTTATTTPPTLPTTGPESGVLAFAGVGLVAMGLSTMLIARRRRDKPYWNS